MKIITLGLLGFVWGCASMDHDKTLKSLKNENSQGNPGGYDMVEGESFFGPRGVGEMDPDAIRRTLKEHLPQFRSCYQKELDPDAIRRTLKEHLPQFRSCYQKELDKGKTPVSGGILELNFVIGPSGDVTKAGVTAKIMSSILALSLKGCIVNVLKGIKFPSPMGGGRVEVNQPINFYPTGNGSQTHAIKTDMVPNFLQEHIPRFLHCYQKELDMVETPASRVLNLSFVIGTSGRMNRASVSAGSSLPSSLKSCVVNVLEEIEFPSSLGGYEVNQSIIIPDIPDREI